VDTPPSSNRFVTSLTIVAFSLLTFAVVVHLLESFQAVLQPLLVAQLLTFVLMPAVQWLQSRGVPALLAYLLLIALAGLILFGLGQLLASSARGFEQRLPEYEAKIDDLTARAVTLVPSLAGQESSVEKRVGNFGSMLGKSLGNAVGLLAIVLVVLINLVFLAAEQTHFQNRVREWFTDTRASQILAAVDQINLSIGRYLGVKIISSLITGVLTGGALGLLGVDFAVLWGLVAFLANFVPYLGPLLTVAPPMLLSLVQPFETHLMPLWVFLALVGIQTLTALAFETVLMGNKLNLSPLVIILSLGFWGQVWGVVGMILAVPLMVVVKTLLDTVPETKFLAALMSKPGPARPNVM